jgi:predicted thioesterase
MFFLFCCVLISYLKISGKELGAQIKFFLNLNLPKTGYVAIDSADACFIYGFGSLGSTQKTPYFCFMNQINVEHLTGKTYSLSRKVTESDSARKYESGLLDVLATPAMIAFMEKVCLESVRLVLPEGYDTVGTFVEVKHFKATPLGDTLTCSCMLTEAAGMKLTFEVEASDSRGAIGKGIHKRAIINTDAFLKQLSK